LKKYILIFVFASASLVAKAQSGFNYYEWGVGAGASIVRPYADLKKQYNDLAFNINFTYNYSPYVPIALELQLGTLRGGNDAISLDKDTRKFNNKYKALILRGDLMAGEIIDYVDNDFLNAIKDFYIGSGIGAISNNVKVNRYSLIDPTYKFPGKDKSVELLIPLRFGYEFKLYDAYDQNSFNISITYQHNITFGEGLDGYNDPPEKFKNNALDQYAQVTVGFKYNFGNTTSYTKLIRSFR
jgi:hypothetical protein